MEGRRLVLNDGTTIENGEAGYSEGSLWLWIRGRTISDVAAIFFDASKTSRITFQFGDDQQTYEGFTNCTSLSVGTDGIVSVCMVKGA